MEDFFNGFLEKQKRVLYCEVPDVLKVPDAQPGDFNVRELFAPSALRLDDNVYVQVHLLYPANVRMDYNKENGSFFRDGMVVILHV